MTEYEQNRINTIIEELSQYTLGGKYDGLSDFSIKSSIINEPNFYKNVTEVAKVLPLIYNPAKTTKSNITQEGKHATERIMRETGYKLLLPDGSEDFQRIFYNIGYLSREFFIISMVYTGFNYVVRDGDVYFRAKHNPTIDKIVKSTIAINIQTENIQNFKILLHIDTQPQLNKHYATKISKSNDKINKIARKIETLKK
uniref:Uncharacterized protein n=1 Tax=viral metagenome TaxID=1070528 RepID=A0A6C0HB60_9ZZZZ